MKEIFKKIGIGLFWLFIVLLILFWQLNKENNILKRNVSSQAKTFYYHKAERIGGYYWGDSVSVQGAWNTTYKNSVKIDCDKTDKTCTLIQASLYSDSDMLDVYKEDFVIKEWNKDFIKAYDESSQYKYELNINLQNEDVTYTKHPLSKTGIFGNELETITFKLYDGGKVDMNINERIVKKAKFWQAPINKLILRIKPLKDDVKIDLL